VKFYAIFFLALFEEKLNKLLGWLTLAGYPVGYPGSGPTGYPAVQFGNRPDTGYQKRPDYPAGRITGASLILSAPTKCALELLQQAS
jgi:hypothetical protein